MEQGDKSKEAGGSNSKAGDKPIWGGIMGKVVEALNQEQRRQKGGEDCNKARPAYVGEGLPPVPPKLVVRIERGEFVEMCELIPEFWMVHTGEDDVPAQRVVRSKGRKQSQNIYVWLQCYAIYVAVMAGKYPERVPELIAHDTHHKSKSGI